MQKLKLDELNRKSVEEFKLVKKIPLIIILENIRSALNVGSVFRSADAFPVEKIILCGITAQPPHKDILKSALGATESVVWEYYLSATDAIAKLKQENYLVYAIEQTDKSTMLNNFFPSDKKVAVVFGNEVEGVSNDALKLVDGSIEVAQYGTKHSLNISVCAGIVMYDLYNKMSV